MMTTEESAEMADAVFVGTVIGTSPPVADVQVVRPLGAIGETVYAFHVDGVAKGDIAARTEIIAGGDGASCGMHFEGEIRYLVFAYATDRGLETGLCSGSVPLEDGVAPPLPMMPVMSEPAPDEAGLPVAALVALGVVAVLAAISAVAFTRDR
jgi:hypothetical protein